MFESAFNSWNSFSTTLGLFAQVTPDPEPAWYEQGIVVCPRLAVADLCNMVCRSVDFQELEVGRFQWTNLSHSDLDRFGILDCRDERRYSSLGRRFERWYESHRFTRS